MDNKIIDINEWLRQVIKNIHIKNKLPQLKNIGVVIQLKIIVQNLKMIFVKIYYKSEKLIKIIKIFQTLLIFNVIIYVKCKKYFILLI